jgi:putative transposase
VRLYGKGQLKCAGDKAVSPVQMELPRLRAENARLRREREIIGKSYGVLRLGIKVKYAWIASNKKHWPASLACEMLGVSTRGYFEHMRRKEIDKSSKPGANKRISNESLLAHIRAIHAEVKQEYVWLNIWKELVARGIRVSNERVRRMMKEHCIKARGKGKFVVTTDSRHNLPIAQNLLQRNFTASTPNQMWTGDITYIATDVGWLYLAVVLDQYSRQVVGWSMRPHMQSTLVADALRMAWFRRAPDAGIIFHSDIGSQYCSHEFQSALAAYKMKSSLCRKGDCWDYVTMKSFWGRLKVGRLYGRKFETLRQAKYEVIDWMTFSNTEGFTLRCAV